MKFIGVSFGVIGNKLVCVATSERFSLVEPRGLSYMDVLAFVSSIAILRKRLHKRGSPCPVLVTYDAGVALELCFQGLTPEQKSVLFGVYRDAENRNKDLPLYDPTTAEYRGVIEEGGFKVSLLAGKILRIARMGHAGLQIYDIAGYFDGRSIGEAAIKYLDRDLDALIEEDTLPLWQRERVERIADKYESEARLIAKLGERVHQVVDPLGLNLRQWYGPSAIAARCLRKWGARRQAKRLTEKNSPYRLIEAIDCAYFGGRPELLKLGTVEDVRTFDLNSAYAYATTLLAQFYTPLRFSRKYLSNAPFSCWLVQYDLPKDVQLGVLPMRLSAAGGVSYRRGGKGYYWQPEVDYLLKRYPGCARVLWGYAGPEYKPVTFGREIRDIYEYRKELKRAGDAGEGIIKLALANLYGKFAQNVGSAYFQCRAWAGWITSFIRRLLLEAVTGIEDRVICFCQDAVHLQGVDARVALGEGLGEWKARRFQSGIYIAPGIYDLRDEGERKTATRGSNLGLDFDRLGADLSERQVAELSRSFFVGWQLSQQNPKLKDRYLEEVEESLMLIPARMKSRSYPVGFDWLAEYRDSKINARAVGRSARYIPSEISPARLRLALGNGAGVLVRQESAVCFYKLNQ